MPQLRWFRVVLWFASIGQVCAIEPQYHPFPAEWGNPVQWAMADGDALLLDRFADGGGELRKFDPATGRIKWTHALPGGCLIGNAFLLHRVGQKVLIEGRSRRSSYDTGSLHSLVWVDCENRVDQSIAFAGALRDHALDPAWFEFSDTLFTGATAVVTGKYLNLGAASQNVVLHWHFGAGGVESHYQHTLPGLLQIPAIAYELASPPGERPALVTVDQEPPEPPVGGARKYFTLRVFRLQADESWQAEAFAVVGLNEVDTRVRATVPLRSSEGLSVFASSGTGANLSSITYPRGPAGWETPVVRDYQTAGALYPVQPGLVLLHDDRTVYRLAETEGCWQSTRLMDGNAFDGSLYETRFSGERILSRALSRAHLMVHDLVWRGPVSEPWFQASWFGAGHHFIDWIGWVALAPAIGTEATWAYAANIGWIAIYGRDPSAFWAYDPFLGFCHYTPEAWNPAAAPGWVFMARADHYVRVDPLPDGSRRFHDSTRDRWFSSHRVPDLGSPRFPWDKAFGDELGQIEFSEDRRFTAVDSVEIDGKPARFTLVGAAEYTVDPLFPSAATLKLTIEYLWILQDENEIQLTIEDVAKVVEEPVPWIVTLEFRLNAPESGDYVMTGLFVDGSAIPRSEGSF